MQNLRIFIVEDFQPWAHAVETILSKEPLYQVISISSDGYAALTEAERLKPDLMLLDVNLRKTSGIDLARALQRINPRPLIVFVSQNASPAIVQAAFEAGANGYILKTDASQELIDAIRTVCEGKRYLSASLKRSVPNW